MTLDLVDVNGLLDLMEPTLINTVDTNPCGCEGAEPSRKRRGSAHSRVSRDSIDSGCDYELARSARRPEMRQYAKKVFKKFAGDPDNDSSSFSNAGDNGSRKRRKKGRRRRKKTKSGDSTPDSRSDDSVSDNSNLSQSDTSDSADDDSDEDRVPFFMMDSTIRAALEEQKRKRREERKLAKKQRKKEKRRLRKERKRAVKQKIREAKRRKRRGTRRDAGTPDSTDHSGTDTDSN